MGVSLQETLPGAKRMHEFCTYQIKVRGSVDAAALNTQSPLQVHTARLIADCAATVFTVHADQSGLIGLLRYLHARGLVFLSVHMDCAAAEEQNVDC
jgi:hypothetical protein